MPNKHSSKTQDINQIAVDLLEGGIGEQPPITSVGKKNPAGPASGDTNIRKR